MSATKWLHAIYLGFSIGFAYFWSSTPALSQYNLQLTGVLVLLYFISLKSVPNKQPSEHSSFLSTAIMTVLCLVLVFSTGSILSPLFFTLVFLLFALALLYEPIQALTATVTLLVVFLSQNYLSMDVNKIINLSYIVFTTPLAIVFGNIYLKNLQSAGRITILKKALVDQETDSLLWISTTAKPSITTILNSISDLVIYSNSKSQYLAIPKEFLEKLKVVQKDLITLYSSTNSLEKSIEESPDNTKL